MSWRSDTGSPTRSGAPSGFRPQKMGSGGFCCQVPPNPACRSLPRQGFRSVFQTALRSLGNRSIVVVGNYEFGPITAEPCRAKARPLRPRRSYFAPTDAAALRLAAAASVEAPGTAPGSDRFITTAIYRHSRLAPARQIEWRRVYKERPG